MNVIEYTDVEILRKELVVIKHVHLQIAEGEFAPIKIRCFHVI